MARIYFGDAITILAAVVLLPYFGVNCQDCTVDITPPEVTCNNATLGGLLPNRFFGLARNSEGYTYDDMNEDFNGVSYSVITGPSGMLFPPGPTPVTLFARDTCGNVATCNFTVFNPLTQLPVNCPDLSANVSTDFGSCTYTYNTTFGPDDVTKDIDGYGYIGELTVSHMVLGGNDVPVGTHQVNTTIADDVLSKICVSTLRVEEPSQRDKIVVDSLNRTGMSVWYFIDLKEV
ncbi:uncharacterized protein [Diadema antillarum]|uniref:uncharacterized protein n=1 Tax=Diadema antillarum TaxID=105358 RepID=UPI003A8452C8